MDIDKRMELNRYEERLKEIQDVHFAYIIEIKQDGGRAIQGKDPALTEHIYDVCLRDIALMQEYASRAKPFSDLWISIYGTEPPVSNFSRAYETMALIEQKRNNSRKSIELCLEAIKNGGDEQRFNELIEVFSKPYKPRVIHEAYKGYWNK